MLSQDSSLEDLYSYCHVDDQPIDFSKRYSDLNSGSKTVGKKRNRSTSASVCSEPIGGKQHCEDDVRVYCIEGTPLIISSSSSMCDIRECSSIEAGVSRKPSDLKDRFSLAEESSMLMELSKENEESQVSKENEDLVVEANTDNESKIVPEENLEQFAQEGGLSELSSPLIFSRSSSVCSFSSSEQHSIVDDRSSISIFSNLTSGIISPSELPDSPGGAMSPFIHKNRHQIFKFPPPEREVQSAGDKLSLEKICNDAYNDEPEDAVKVYNTEGLDPSESMSMSSFSELSIQTCSHTSLTLSANGINIAQKTLIKVDCVTTTEKLLNSHVDYLPMSEEVLETLPLPSVEKSVFGIQPRESSTFEENNYLQDEPQSPSENVDSTSVIDITHALVKDEDAEYDISFTESDEEADALLEECIRSGKTFQSTSDAKNCESASDMEIGNKTLDVESNLCDMNNENSLLNKNGNILEGKKESESEVASDSKVIEDDYKTEELSKRVKTIEEAPDVEEQSLEDNNAFDIEAAESCNSLSDSDDEANALLDECINYGKPDSVKSKGDIKLMPTMCFSPLEVLPKKVVRECSVERKSPSEPRTSVVQKPLKQGINEKSRKASKMSDSSSSKYFRQKSVNSSPNSKVKHELHHGITTTNAFQCCNSFQRKKCRFEQNLRSFHGMKPYRPEFLQERTSDPMKKLRKEILIGLYGTLNDDKPNRNSKPLNAEYEDEEDVLLNQCIKLGMPEKNSQKHMPSYSPSPLKTTNHVHSMYRSNDRHFTENSTSRANHQFAPLRTVSRAQEILHAGLMHSARLNQQQLQSKSRYNPPPFNNQLHPRRNQSSHTVLKSVSKGSTKHIHQKIPNYEEFCRGIEEVCNDRDSDFLQQYIQLGMPTKSRRQKSQPKVMRGSSSFQTYDKTLGYRDNHRPDGISDEDDDDILMACINAGRSKGKIESKTVREKSSPNRTSILTPNKLVFQQQGKGNINNDKYTCINDNINLHQPVSFTSPKSRWMQPCVQDHVISTPTEESPCVYKTEDTPVLSPTPSMSDLSCLSFNEDKSTCSNLNNSRNSDISSESDDDDDDDLLMQCIQSGMPSPIRTVAGT